MAILSLHKLDALAKESPLVAAAQERLAVSEIFHLLRDADSENGKKVSRMLSSVKPELKEQYVKWMSVCNGGLLFETALLSADDYDADLALSFDDLASNNTPAAYKQFNLPAEGFFVIGVRSYGDPICLCTTDGKVYLYNLEENDFTEIWDTFFDFLADEVDEFMALLADDALEPIPLKLLNHDDDEPDAE